MPWSPLPLWQGGFDRDEPNSLDHLPPAASVSSGAETHGSPTPATHKCHGLRNLHHDRFKSLELGMNTIAQSPADQEIRLSEYLAVLRRTRWRLGSFVIACTLGAMLAGLILPTKYTAKIVVAPVTSSPSAGRLGGVASMVSQFGGLASLAGISLGEDTQRAETLAVLESSALTERYIEANDLLPKLYPRRWDPSSRQWRVSEFHKAPTLWGANQLFRKKVRTISTNAKSGIVTMKITWTNPRDAATWANGLVAMTNDYLQAKAISQAQRNIQYLNEQAEKTTLVPVKNAIYAILESEINKEMLARGTQEYALKVLDPAQAPQRPSSLPLFKWILIGFFGSLGVALASVFFRVAWGQS